MKMLLLALLSTLLFAAADGTASKPFPVYRSANARVVFDIPQASLPLYSVTIQIGTSENDWTAPLKNVEYVLPEGYPQSTTENEIRFDAVPQLVSELPDGLLWLRLKVKRDDMAESIWAAPLAIKNNSAPMGSPGGCRTLP